MMHSSERKTAEHTTADRVEHPDQPIIVFSAVNPDQHMPARPHRAGHTLDGKLGLCKVMNDTDREYDVKSASFGDFIDRLSSNFHGSMRGEIGTCRFERALVEIDSDTASCAFSHRPVAVASHTATAVKEVCAAADVARQRRNPLTELFLM